MPALVQLRDAIEAIHGTGGRRQAIASFRQALKPARACSHGVPILMAHCAVLEASHDNVSGKHARARKRLATATALAEETTNYWVMYEVLLARAQQARATGGERERP